MSFSGSRSGRFPLFAVDIVGPLFDDLLGRPAAAVVPLHVSAAPPERTGAHGAAFAAAAAGAPTSVVRVTTEWDEPYGGAPVQRTHATAAFTKADKIACDSGVATETFALSGTVLTVDTAMQFKSLPGGVAYRTVYRRC